MKELKKRILHGSKWAFAGKTIAGLLTLSVNILITRLLTPDEVGVYFLTFSLVSVLSLVAQTGINQAIVRMIAESQSMRKPQRSIAVIRSAYFLVGTATLFIITTLLGGAGEWISTWFFNGSLTHNLILLTALWIVARTFRTLLAETFRGFHDIRHATLFDGVMDSLIFTLLLGGLYIHHGAGNLNQVFWFAIGANSVNVIAASLLLQRRLKKVSNGKEHITPREILTISWPMWITGITIFILGQADLWVMSIFREQHEVGVYAAVKKLVALVSISLVITNAVVPPLIAELNVRKKKATLERTLRATTTIAAIPALVALGIFIFYSDLILVFIYGKYYASGSPILLILCVGQIVNVCCGSCGNALMMTGHQVIMLKISIICGMLSLLLALLLASRFGGPGVAAGVSTALILQNILMLISAKQHLGIWTHLDLHLIWDKLTRNQAKQA